MFWLRLQEGLDFEEFQQRTGVDCRQTLGEVLRPFVELGFASVTAEAARITERGVAVSDHILKRVLPAMEAHDSAN